jgi:hypothetical protein
MILVGLETFYLIGVIVQNNKILGLQFERGYYYLPNRTNVNISKYKWKASLHYTFPCQLELP